MFSQNDRKFLQNISDGINEKADRQTDIREKLIGVNSFEIPQPIVISVLNPTLTFLHHYQQ